MPYEIHYSNEEVGKLKKLRAFDRTAILDQIEQLPRVNPAIVSKLECLPRRSFSGTTVHARYATECYVFGLFANQVFATSS
jgi:hypothetical protein